MLYRGLVDLKTGVLNKWWLLLYCKNSIPFKSKQQTPGTLQDWSWKGLEWFKFEQVTVLRGFLLGLELRK